MSHCLSKINSFVFLFLFSFNALAQDYDAGSDFFGEAPVVLTVSRMHKPLSESPASVTVIDRQMIRNSGAREIADLFRMVPGMAVGFLDGNRPIVTYHGLGHEFHRQLQVLIDGRSVFIPAYGGVLWSDLPLLIEDIERIEVTRGPNAVTYGSNAFLATINIITRHAAEDIGSQVVARHHVGDGPEMQDVYVRYGNQYKDFDWRISAGRESDDGLIATDPSDDPLKDDKTVEKVNFRADFLTSHNQFWSLQSGFNQGTYGKGEGESDNVFRDADTSNYFHNIKWELIQPNVQTTVQLTHARHEFNDSFIEDTLLAPFATVDVSFDRESERTDLEIYQNRQFTEQLSLNYGFSARHDEVQSFFLFSDEKDHDVDTNSIFSSLEWKPREGTSIDFGFLLEDSNVTSRETSYRLTLIQQIDNHHLRLVSSSAKRNPVLWELIGETTFFAESPLLPQPVPVVTQWINMNDVEPETILSNEIGLFSEFLDRQLTTDIKLFSYRISDSMVDLSSQLLPVPLSLTIPGVGTVLTDDDFDTIINAGNTKVDGIELSFNFSPQHKNYRLYGGLSNINAESFSADYVNSFPDNTYFAGGHIDISPRHQISATAYYIDTMSWIDFDNDTVGDYQKVDVRYQFMINPDNDIKLELIGYNLAGRYSSYRESEQHDTSYLVKLSGRL